jgi:hypothetical protein
VSDVANTGAKLLFLCITLTSFLLSEIPTCGSAMYSTGFEDEFKVSWTVPFFSFLFFFLRARLLLAPRVIGFVINVFCGVIDCKLFLLNVGLLTLYLPLLCNTFFSTISTPRRQMIGHPLPVNSAFHVDCN